MNLVHDYSAEWNVQYKVQVRNLILKIALTYFIFQEPLSQTVTNTKNK